MTGRTLGRYRLLEQIGSGGMGLVYRARDDRLERDVALKVLPPEMVADRGARARLLREARSAAALNHPHVCTVYEVGEDGDQVFIAMELVQGRSLRAPAGAAGMPATTVLRHGVEVADALAHAHAHGVIHRDLKCANVMVTAEGRIKVLDFGLARRVAGPGAATVAMPTRSLTEPGAIVGTPHYLSPEVLHGAEADARSDLWALGVMLHEMLAGELPFAGQTEFEVAAAIMHAPPGPLPDTVPAGLRAVIGRCLEKEPAHRYRSADEVRAALEALRSGSGGAEAGAPSPPTASRHARPPSRAPVVTWVSAAAVLVVLVLLMFADRSGLLDVVLHREVAPVSSVAVLPLTDLSGDPGQTYFADGMTDELITSLGKVSALTVIARSSVMGYRGKERPLRRIARALGVGIILEGSVLRAGDKVRVSVQLIRAASGRLVWSESYERGLTDVLALQSEVALAIAREIQVQLLPGEQARLARVRPVNPRAHEAYLMGRHHWNEFTRDGFRLAIREFRRAAELDSTYAMARVGLADTYYSLSNWYMAPDSAMPLVREAVARALELDESLADARTLRAQVRALYEWDFAEAERDYRRAIELNPSSGTAHLWYGYFLLYMGRFEDALPEIARAGELDPLSSWPRWLATWPAFYRRDYEQAARELEALAERDPQAWYTYSLLGETYEQQGRYPEAIAQLRRARVLGGNPWVHAALARALAGNGEPDSLRRALRDLETMSHEQYVSPYATASVHLALGDRGRALDLLERAADERSEDVLLLRIDPRMDRLRSEPRFVALLRRIGMSG